jgi:hypothetical protein
MAILQYRTRPEPWASHRERAKYAWLIPLFAIEWVWSWLAYWLSGGAFLEVLEYLGTLSLLLAVVSYFLESGDRIMQKHYQFGRSSTRHKQREATVEGWTLWRSFTRMACRW